MLDLDSFLTVADHWNKLGSSVQEQLQDAYNGDDLDNLNSNALEICAEFLTRCRTT